MLTDGRQEKVDQAVRRQKFSQALRVCPSKTPKREETKESHKNICTRISGNPRKSDRNPHWHKGGFHVWKGAWKLTVGRRNHKTQVVLHSELKVATRTVRVVVKALSQPRCRKSPQLMQTKVYVSEDVQRVNVQILPRSNFRIHFVWQTSDSQYLHGAKLQKASC